jgi:hypothetical protein
MHRISPCHALTLAVVALVGGLLLTSCGMSTPATAGIANSPAATATAVPPTDTPMPPSAAPAETTCLPDDYGLYAAQTTYFSALDAFNLPAPPQTKHGIGDSGTNANGTFGGDPGMCTVGTAASINAFYSAHLPALGWSHSLPPVAVTQKCTAGGAPWGGVQWWKGNGLFAWQISGSAAGGSVFWSYSFCQAA